MGHIRLGTLSQSQKWREVVALLNSDAPPEQIAQAAPDASERDLKRASDDPIFNVSRDLLVTLPLQARSPFFLEFVAGVEVLRFDLDGEERAISLKISQLTQRMVAGLPDRTLNLLELADRVLMFSGGLEGRFAISGPPWSEAARILATPVRFISDDVVLVTKNACSDFRKLWPLAEPTPLFQCPW